MIALWLALGAPASDDLEWARAIDWVDRLGWAASRREVSAMLRLDGEGSFDRALRPEDQGLVSRLEDPTVYAVEADLVEINGEQGRRMAVSLRQAIVYHNPAAVPLECLSLRVYPNAVGDVVVHGAWIDNRPVPSLLIGTRLKLCPAEPIAPGRRTRVLLELTESVPAFDPRQPLGGSTLDPASTGEYGFYGAYVNLGRWLPLIAPVGRDGSFELDELAPNTEHARFDPAMFHVVLSFPERLSAATTGVELARREGGGTATIVAVASAAREFAVQLGAGISVLEATVSGTRLRVFHPTADPQMGRALLEHARAGLELGVELYGPLATSELDVVEAPIRVALGMEYPGLVTVDVHHKHGIYSPSEIHEWTVVHEIAHQWWSAEVGNDPGAAPWLDEGLASFTTGVYWARRHGPEALRQRQHLDVIEPTAALQGRGTPDLPADLPAWRYDLFEYSAIVYGRAALFFEVLRHQMGEPALWAALRQYRAEQWGQLAEAEDLLRALRAHSAQPEQIDALYRRWIHEGHGYEDLLPRFEPAQLVIPERAHGRDRR
ncbi:MAG TPA: hypothetical protein ENK18_23715 [Deltaproteobacteria bacterium]|nr:hypothetical protein [Deltaproteobacteria bacterium]